MCSLHGQLCHSPRCAGSAQTNSHGQSCTTTMSAGLFGLLLCCSTASLSRAEQSICHGCGESSSQRSQASLAQLKHCRGFAPQCSPALRKMSFIQQLGAQCLSLSGKHLKNSFCFMPGYQAMVWPAHTTRATLRAPCVAPNSGTLPTSFFSCLLFSLFTFQELSEVFPVCLYPASVLIFLFFSSFFLYFFFFPWAASVEPCGS